MLWEKLRFSSGVSEKAILGLLLTGIRQMQIMASSLKHVNLGIPRDVGRIVRGPLLKIVGVLL
ncbi:hypothetical protein DFAR_2650010 [Desulfarculales bacterium]